MPKFILIPLIVIGLLVLSVVVLLPILLDEDKVLELAAAKLHEETGATLTVSGDKKLSLFPELGVSLGDAAITMAQQPEPALRVRALSIGVQLMPLLSGSVEIDTISLDGLSARIESAAEETPAVDTSKFSDEQLDEFYARKRRVMEEAGVAAGAEAALVVPLALNVKRLLITDSRLEMIDPDSKESSVVELQEIQATGLNLAARPIPLQAKVRLAGEQPIDLVLEGKLSVDQATQILNIAQLELLVSGATAEPVRLNTHGDVDISRQIADLTLELELGATRGRGTLRFASFESPQINTRLKLNLLDPALLVLAGPEASGAAGDSAPAAAGDSGDSPLPLDAIRLIDTRADLSIEQAVFGAHRISNLKVLLRAVDGVIRVPTLTGELHGGKLDAKVVFNGKHNTAKLNTSGNVQSLDMATALAAMESDPIVTGTASLDWKLASNGKTVNELIAALKGPINLSTDKPVLKGMGVEKMVCQAVALVNQEALTAQFPADTAFQTLGAELKLSNGKMNLRPLRAELQHIKLNGSGSLDLLSQDFKATFKARLSPELENVDRACRVSKRLTAIDWPVKCKGKVSGDPAKWCGVETEDIIADLAKYEAQSKVKKEAGKLMDKLFK